MELNKEMIRSVEEELSKVASRELSDEDQSLCRKPCIDNY